MAKQTGIGTVIQVDDSAGTARDISDDITNYDIGIAQNTIDVTTISKSAMEKLIGLKDLTVTLSGIFDAAANKWHAVFGTTSGVRTVDIRIGGDTTGNPRLQAEMVVTNYDISQGADGNMTVTAGLVLQNGTDPTFDTVP